MTSGSFPTRPFKTREIRNGHLKQKYDVIVLTNVSSETIVDGHEEGTVPSQYAGGIGEHGLAALLQFVKDGGTLITFNVSSLLPIEHFKVPLRDVSKSYPSTEFFLPSAILKVDIDNYASHRLWNGRNRRVLSYGSPVFELLDIDGDGIQTKRMRFYRISSRRPLSQRQSFHERSPHRRSYPAQQTGSGRGRNVGKVG